MGGNARCSAWIEWTPYPTPAALQHVRIDHRRLDVLVPQEFLHGPNIVPVLQQVRSKAVAQRMATAALIELRLAYRLFYCLLADGSLIFSLTC
jgi:hypothetical protein